MELSIQSKLRERAAVSSFDPMRKLLIAAASRIDELEDALAKARADFAKVKSLADAAEVPVGEIAGSLP